MPETLLDRDHLRHAAFNDVELMREVLGLFRNQADLWAPLLEASTTNQHWADAAHSLKGSARGVGAKALAAACDGLETLARAPGPLSATAIAVHIDDIRQILGATLTETLRFDQELALTGSRKAS